MAMWTIIKFVMAIFFGYLAYIVIGPMVFISRYDNPQWDDMPMFMKAFGDQMYGIWILFIVIMGAVLIYMGINEANRNRSLEQ